MLLIERSTYSQLTMRQALGWALVYPLLIALAYVFKPTLREFAALWPAGAAAFGAYLLLPFRAWKWVALVTTGWELVSVIVVSLVMGWHPKMLTVLSFALANAVTAALPAAALRARGLLSQSDHYQIANVPRALVALGLGSLPGAILGALAQGRLPGRVPQVQEVGIWLLASVLAIVTYGPLLFEPMLPTMRVKSGPATAWERILVPALILVALVTLLFAPTGVLESFLNPTVLLLVAMIWLALRFSPREMRIGVAIVSTSVLTICAHNAAALRLIAGTTEWRPAVVSIDMFLLAGTIATVLINLLRVQQGELIRELELEQQQLRRYAEVLDRAEENARRAVAGDLHDGIGQVLAGQAMTIGAMRMHAASPILGDLIDQATHASQEAQRGIRLVIQDLSPPELENASAEQMLEYLAVQFQSRYGFEVSWQVGSGVALTAEQTRLIYRCVRELLYNAFKHSQRDSAEVSVLKSGQMLVVMVTDDGIGFDVERSRIDPKHRFGLLQLHQRIQAERGSVRIDSGAGEGCCVTLRLPVDSESLVAAGPD